METLGLEKVKCYMEMVYGGQAFKSTLLDFVYFCLEYFFEQTISHYDFDPIFLDFLMVS